MISLRRSGPQRAGEQLPSEKPLIEPLLTMSKLLRISLTLLRPPFVRSKSTGDILRISVQRAIERISDETAVDAKGDEKNSKTSPLNRHNVRP